MSNDLKFFIFRIGTFALLVFEWIFILTSIGNMFANPDNYSRPRVILSFILILLTLPIAVYYHFLKQKRWGPQGFKTQQEVDVETLGQAGHDTYVAKKQPSASAWKYPEEKQNN